MSLMKNHSITTTTKKVSRLIFEDRMQGWFFDPAFKPIEMEHPVAAVHIVTPLIEALRCYKEGRASKRGESVTFFKNEAEEIFPPLKTDDAILSLLYKGVRCGFAHQGFVKDNDDNTGYNILIPLAEKESDPIVFEDPVITIYSRQYVTAINSAYQGYFESLDSDESLLNKFFDLWKKQWEMKQRYPAFSGTSTKS